METTTQEPYKQGIPVKFDIQERDGFVIGTMTLEGTNGRGRFEFSCAGPLEDVRRYESEARILRLEITDLAGGEDSLAEQVAAAHDESRAYWDEWLDTRCAAAHALIASASLELLTNSEALLETLGKDILVLDRLEPQDAERVEDPRVNRILRIKPLERRNPDAGYLLSFQVDPTVSQGKTDVYLPEENSTSVSATATPSGSAQNLNLSLKIGTRTKEAVHKGPGQAETVSSPGSPETPRLWVHGVTTVTYGCIVEWSKLRTI